jgi:hypothetical protein
MPLIYPLHLALATKREILRKILAGEILQSMNNSLKLADPRELKA